jgi:YbbR domain-containing protein
MLRRNLSIKAGALLFAIFLWFWVMFSEQNPLVQKSVEVKVTMVGASPGLIAHLDAAKVRVTVRGLEQDLSDLTSVTAQANCRGLSAGQHRVRIRVKVPRDVTVVAIRPFQVKVLLEQIISKKRAVEIELTGEPFGNYQLQEVTSSPETVRIEGAESLVGQVARVRVSADLSRLVPGVPTAWPALALDRAGQPVPGVRVSPSQVKVTALSEHTVVTKVVPVILRTRGVLPEGLTVASVQLDPPMVTIIALMKQAEEITSLETEPLSLASLHASATRELRLIVPEGASLAQEPRVRVTIKVKEQGEAGAENTLN